MQDEQVPIFQQPAKSYSSADAAVATPPASVIDLPQPATGLPPLAEPFSLAGWLKKWSSLFVLSLALAIIVMDSTILNVSLEVIIKDIHTNIQGLQWVISAYSLTLAALTIIGGRFGDFFGRKKMFMFGAVLFAAGSFMASISPNVVVLLLGESIVEGIGAALMMPATASLLVSNFHGKDRAKAFGLWGGVAGASSAIGPILGGWLTNNYSWRWAFRINVGVAALLLLGSVLVKEAYDVEEKPQLDFVGMLLSALGLLAVVYGVIESSTYGWWRAKQDFFIGNYGFTIFHLSIVPFVIIFGVLLLDLFIEWELKRMRDNKTPLVSMTLFKNLAFTSGTVTTAIITLGQFGIFFILPIYLQGVHGLDALHTGIVNLPLSLSMLVMAPLSGFLSHKILPKHIIQFGLLLNIAALVVLWAGLDPTASTNTLIPGLILYGTGMGLVMAQISNLTLSAVSVQQAGEASGVNNTLRQIGSTLGSSIIGAILLLAIANNVTVKLNNSPQIPPQVRSAVITSVNDPNSNLAFGGSAVSGNLPPTIASQIETISKQATVDAAKQTLLYAVIFVLLGFFASFTLPAKVTPRHATGPAGGH